MGTKTEERVAVVNTGIKSSLGFPCSDCGGEVSEWAEAKGLNTKTGFGDIQSCENPLVCEKCGKLHKDNENPVIDEEDNIVFLKDGWLIYIPAKCDGRIDLIN